jgi:hypothetical protein
MSVDESDPEQFGFPSKSQIYSLSKDVRKEINLASLRISGADSFDRFWNRILTPTEREILGGSEEVCFKTKYVAYFLVELRSFSLERSIVEIAFHLGFFNPQTYHWLVSELKELPTRLGSEKPVWDRDSGCLMFRGSLSRKVHVKKARNIVQVLDSFQEQGWPSHIDFPIESDNPQLIHETNQSFNENAKGMRFHAQGKRVCWETDNS